MKSGMICCLALVAVFGDGCSILGGRTVVTDVNANKLLSAVGAELGAPVVIDASQGWDLPVNQYTAPTEAILPVRSADSGTWGRAYRVVNKDKWSAEVQLGVFANRKAARAVFRAHLLRSCVGPDKDLTRELGTKALGWSFRRQRRNLWGILFVRDNVVIFVNVFTPKLAEDDGSTRIVTALAHAIDKALVDGTSGVQRGKTLKVPRIVAVEPLDVVPPGGTVQVHIMRVNVQDRKIECLETVRDFPFYPTRVGGTYRVTYVTPGCVVASKAVGISGRSDATDVQ